MSLPAVSHGGQLLDLPTRQFVVFEEVLENFEAKCCDEHDKARQTIARQVRSAYNILQMCWAARENREHQNLIVQSKTTGIEFTQLIQNRDNFTYHCFSLVLSMWCMKLVQFQKCFQALHGHRLLRMKMPPGSHEVSQNQLYVQFYTAAMSYQTLAALNSRVPPMTPLVLVFLLQIVGRCRTSRNPIMFHKVSILIEYVIREVNKELLNSSLH